MAMRLSGLMSGMDTESIVQELVAVKQTKIDEMVKEQTKLEWKQDAWKELNNKIKKLYNGTLSNLRFQSAYAKKTTKISDSSVAEIITSDSAMDSVQKLRVKTLAQSGYLTGAEVSKADGSKCTSGTKLVDMGIEAGSKIEVNTKGKTVEITIEESTTMSNLVSKLQNAGLKANFDSKTQRLFIGASESGEAADFSITAANEAGTNALDKLGILVYDDDTIAKYEAIANMDTDTYNANVEAEVAKRLAEYVKKAENLEKSITTLNENLEKIVDEYGKATRDDYEALVEAAETDDEKKAELEALREELKAELTNVVDEENGTSSLEELKADVEEIQAQLEAVDADETLTDEEKTEAKAELQTELDELNEKLGYMEKYQATKKSITDAETELAEVKANYTIETTTDENGETVETPVAATTVTDAVKAELDAKIAEAQKVIDAKADAEADGKTFTGSAGATKVDGLDAEIYLNDAYFTSSDNTFEINGLTITCNDTTGDDEVTLTTQNDTSGVYDMIKEFIVEYSELINEMDKLYNADSAKGYEPLTDDEKYEMSEKEIEKWEEKIKDSLLRRDATLSSVSSAFKSIMSSGFTVGGKTMYLSDFGIETLGYFEAADNERNAYHIDGDEDDEHVSSETNTLKAMISSDPDAVMDFFSQLTKSLYDKTSDLMASVKDYSSSYTVYEDKKMQSDYDDYTEKIKDLEEKLADYEDKWYSKFSAMETAMAKMQSNANAITSLIGG